MLISYSQIVPSRNMNKLLTRNFYLLLKSSQNIH
nr:MAG TPA: hypothetical protein [Caudoviricetes sp.]